MFPNELLSLFNEVFEPIQLPKLRVGWDQVFLQVCFVLSRKPLIRHRVPFTTRTILLHREQHTVCKLITLSIAIPQQVLSACSWILDLDLPELTLRENVIHLRHVAVEGRCVVEGVHQVEQQVDRVGAVPHLPKAVLG